LVKEEGFTISIEGKYLLIKSHRSPDIDRGVEDLLKIRDSVLLTNIRNLVIELDLEAEISIEFLEKLFQETKDIDLTFMYEIKAAFLSDKSSVDKLQKLDGFNKNQNLQTKIFTDLDDALSWLEE